MRLRATVRKGNVMDRQIDWLTDGRGRINISRHPTELFGITESILRKNINDKMSHWHRAPYEHKKAGADPGGGAPPPLQKV